jgi:hypothetical protein
MKRPAFCQPANETEGRIDRKLPKDFILQIDGFHPIASSK